MLIRSPQYRIPLAAILTDKWLKFEHELKHKNHPQTIKKQRKTSISKIARENLEKSDTISATYPKKKIKQSVSNRPTTVISNSKLFNSINSIFLTSEKSIASNSSSASQISKDSSFDSFSKKSKFSISNKSLSGVKEENKNEDLKWMASGTDHVLTNAETKKRSVFYLIIASENVDFNEFDDEDDANLGEIMKFLTENKVVPKLSIKFRF